MDNKKKKRKNMKINGRSFTPTHKKDKYKPDYTWDNGCKVIETPHIAWKISEVYSSYSGYQYLSITPHLSFFDESVTFQYWRLDNKLSINNIDFYVKNLAEATKYVLNYIKYNNIDLDDTIYITPNIKKQRERIKKIKRIKKNIK